MMLRHTSCVRWTIQLLAAYLLFAPSISPAANDPTPIVDNNSPSVLVQVVPVARHSLKDTVTAFGRVLSDSEQASAITLPRAGLVSRLWVRLGQRVTAGQALLKLDTAPATNMQYQQAEAAANFSRTDLERVQRLFREQLATREQVSTAIRSLRDVEAQLRAQRKIGNDRSAEIMHAPFAGIVTQLSVSRGQRVPADTLAIRLASRGALVVPLGLEQEDAVRVQPGQAVALISVFRPEIRVGAKVTDVHAMVNQQTRLVDVYVRVPKEAADGMILGEAMRGVITLRQSQVLVVPRSAILRDDRGAYIFVVRAGRAHRVEIVPGLEADGFIGVSGKLKEGDPVVTVGNYELTDGMAVREITR
ncbi:MAG: efflux RND transporter periplasmic adaptor subunit [Sulfuricaulis sp.]